VVVPGKPVGALVDAAGPLLAASTTSQDASSLLVADIPQARLSW
jgi:hypothetical protein